jgi:hypothetical protein
MKSLNKLAVVLIAILFVSLGCNLNGCQAVSAPEETTELYQSFLTDVMGVNLTEYNITSSGYGTSYPSTLGGKVKEETISYTLDSGQGKLSTWCLIEDSNMQVCSLYPIEGQTIFSNPINLDDSIDEFMQKYQAFVSQTSKKDTSYLGQAMSLIENVDFQTATEKTAGNMRLKVTPNTNDIISIEWAYSEYDVELIQKHVELKFENGSLSWFVDTWDLYSVYDQEMISQEEAQSIAFEAAQAKPINMFDVQDSEPAAVQVTPDWNGWTYTVKLNLVRSTQTVEGTEISNDNLNIHGDPLTLYPLWHFVFYFGKPIGNTLGVEVGVWADNGEVAYSNIYGYLGDSTSSTAQSSGETINTSSATQSQYLVAIIVGAIIAVAIGSLVIVRKKNKNKQ